MNSNISESLAALDEHNIPYVCWKNMHEIGLALDNRSDLDIYIPVTSKNKALSCFNNENWCQLRNPVATFPWVMHLFKVCNGKSSHIHIYFKLVTGESWLKEYVLPNPLKVLSSRIRSNEYGVYILSNEAQARIFAIRHLLKGGSFFSRLLYWKEVKSYEEEWLSCSGSFHVDGSLFGACSIEDFIRKSGLYSKSLELPSWRYAFIFRSRMSPFLRYNRLTLPFRRLASFSNRLMNKLFWKQKKLFIGPGLVIAISGVDGAGKSTMLSELSSFYSQFLTVDTFHLGRPYGKVINFFRKFLKRNDGESISSDNYIYQETSRSRAIKATIVSLLRLRLSRKATQQALTGKLLLVDRWPTSEIGKMDGPRLRRDLCVNWLARLCCRVESWAYKNIPSADVCVFVQVPLEAALERNKNRIKQEKESQKEIVRRYNENSKVRPIADKVINFDNVGELTEKRIMMIDLLWKEIAARQ